MTFKKHHFGIWTKTPVKRRTKGKTTSTTGYAIAHDTIHAETHFPMKFSTKPTFNSMFTNEIMPLIKHDKNRGMTQAIFLDANLGIFPMILGI